MQKIQIALEGKTLTATLFDTPTAGGILKILPVQGRVEVWGEEIYFSIPVKMDLEENAREEVDVGDLGYWPQGPAFCIFFGPTPASTSDRPRAYSPVNVFGTMDQDVRVLKEVQSGAFIRVAPLKP